MKLRKFRAERGYSGVLAMRPSALTDEYGQAKTETQENDGIAIVSVSGPLEHHFGWWFDSYEAILCRVEDAMLDEQTKAVVMVFDTPGGDASGVEEAHRKLRLMSEQSGKTIFAYSNEACYSAGYWLASAAREIWLPPTGGVGSVGVIAAAVDCTEANRKAGVKVEFITTGARKADGHPDRPLTDEIIETMQARVDQIGQVFFDSVGEAREMSADAVRALEAGCFLGEEAISAGLADGVASWDEFLDLVRGEISGVDAPGPAVGNMGGSDPIGSARRPSTMKAKPLLALTQAVTKAEAAVEAAKTPEERKAALKALRAASAAEAKMKYSKKTVEESEEDDGEAEEEESEEESEEEESDDPPPSSKKKDDDDGDDDDDEDEEEDDEDEEEADEDGDSKKAKSLKALTGKTGKPRVEQLFAAACALTGETNISRVLGALSGIKVKVDRADKLHADVSKLKATQRRADVDAMLSKASREGRVSPAATASLRAQGLKDPKWLKGHLAALPKSVRTTEDGGKRPDAAALGETPKLAYASMDSDQRKMVEDGAASAGVSVDKFIESMNERRAKAGLSPTH